MKILTEKQLVEIENQTLNTIYQALNVLHERDNSSPEGIVKDRHDELLDIALNAFSSKPKSEHIYPWIRVSVNFNKIFFPSNQ